MQDSLPRKLAAILYADVVDYSRLTEDDEDSTHKTLSENLDFIGSEIRNRDGNVVHYAGDAILAEFPTVTGALECALNVQSSLETRNKKQPHDRKMKFRI